MANHLLESVISLNNKIKVAATTATAEEMAYLGSAIEKIGGQLSLYDLIEHVDDLKEILENKTNDLKIIIQNASDDKKQENIDQLQTFIDSFLLEIDNKIINFNNTKDNTIEYINSKSIDTQNEINFIMSNSISEISTLINDLRSEILQLRYPETIGKFYFYNSF